MMPTEGPVQDPSTLTPIKTVHPIGSSNATLHRPNDSRGSAHQSSSATFKCCRESVYSWYRWKVRSGETGGGMGDIDSKIARSWMRILRAGAASLLTMAAPLLTERAASAQEYRGTEQQRVACTPDVFRLCSWEIPNVERIVSCLRREKISVECRLPSGLRDRGGRITGGPQQRRAAPYRATPFCTASLTRGI